MRFLLPFPARRSPPPAPVPAPIAAHALPFPLVPALLALAVFSLTRLALLLLAWPDVAGEWPAVGVAMLRGLAGDLPVAAALALPFFALDALSRRPLRWLRFVLFSLLVFLLLFVAVAEGVFWDEFGARFNFIALDYLVFTTEVIGNLRETYPVGTILAGLALLTVAIVHALRERIAVRPGAAAPGRRPARRAVAGLLGLMLLPLVLLRGGAEFSGNAYLDGLADNGWRSFVRAARQNRLDYRRFYATLPDAEALRGLARLAGHPLRSASEPAVVPAALAGAAGGGPRPNVVVVMMESLSAEFMTRFGGTDALTPNLDRLAGEGLLFSRLYASGTRTVRGLEALSAALPPLPGKSLVRWPESDGLNTLGGSFARHGWRPYFIYGGYGAFDNMNAYFSGNGHVVVDRPAFPETAPGEERFTNIWGVADEHLFEQVIATLDREHASGTPVFAHVMTTSNHVPFTYPDGRIDIPSPGGRKGAIRYADYAIGRFIAQAREKPWFDNTLFLFVADHCARSAGRTRIPVPRYHIPAIVYAPKIVSPRVVDTLSSQIDLAPTLLALAGVDEHERFLGRDILTMRPEEGRALLSTYQNLGYLKGDVLTVLSPKGRVEAFRVDPESDAASPVAADPDLSAEAIAWFQGTAILLDAHRARHAR